MSAGVDGFSTHGGSVAVIPHSALFHFFFQPLRLPNESEGRRSFYPGVGRPSYLSHTECMFSVSLSPSRPPYNASPSVTKQNNRSPSFYTDFVHRIFSFSVCHSLSTCIQGISVCGQSIPISSSVVLTQQLPAPTVNKPPFSDPPSGPRRLPQRPRLARFNLGRTLPSSQLAASGELAALLSVPGPAAAAVSARR
jgi:hypothetical protein